jgi:sulfatase modifying factor 1
MKASRIRSFLAATIAVFGLIFSSSIELNAQSNKSPSQSSKKSASKKSASKKSASKKSASKKSASKKSASKKSPGGSSSGGSSSGGSSSGGSSSAWAGGRDGPTPNASAMIPVQGGTLPTSSGLADKSVSTFQIGKYEVTWDEWQNVREWAVSNGYTDLTNVGGTYPTGTLNFGNLPVVYVNWFDAVKWCNAKSEKEGLTPVYVAYGDVYRSGMFAREVGSTTVTTNPSANGYRLPSEKEWEWAARGGSSSQGYIYSGSNDLNDVAWHGGNSIYGQLGYSPHAAGMKAPNELGIHDMSGNVSEWCNDRLYGGYLKARGGSWSWSESANEYALAFRDYIYDPVNTALVGFRLARNSDQ